MTTSPRTFGYDANFDPPLKKRLECPICLLAQKDPLQTPCGHRFCANCIDNALRLTGQRCPIDNKALSLTQLFPDNFARREVLSLTVLCNNSKPGCVWKGELRELEDHLRVCQFIEIQCPFSCGSTFMRDRFFSHQQECEKKPIPCTHCEIVFPSEQMEEHQQFCSKMKPQLHIHQLLLQHKLLKWTGYLQFHGPTPTTTQAHFLSFDSQEINTVYWPPNLKFAMQSGSKECDQSLDLGKRMNQIMKVEFITDTIQNMEKFFIEKMFYVCRISYSKKRKNDLILQLVWNSEKRECVLCVFKDANIKFLTKKMENRTMTGIHGTIRGPNHSAMPGQVWPPVASISINSAIPRINIGPDILLSQPPTIGVTPTNTPVITQPVWSPLLVYPLSAYVGTPNILTYSQLNTSPINFPSTYMDAASYILLDRQNPTPSSVMHTQVSPVDHGEDVLVDPLLYNIHDDELAQNAEAVWFLNNLNESSERLDNQFMHGTNPARSRTRRSQSYRTDPYTIPERYHDRTPGYPLPHLSDITHQRLTVPLQTVLPSVSAAVVYPTSVSLPQQLVTGVAPPVTSFILTSLENATSHIIGSAYSSAAAHSDSLNAQVDRPSLAVLQGGIATAITDLPTHVPAVIPAPTLSLHSDSLLNMNIWDQGYMPIHISATQHQPGN